VVGAGEDSSELVGSGAGVSAGGVSTGVEVSPSLGASVEASDRSVELGGWQVLDCLFLPLPFLWDLSCLAFSTFPW
jgi:hypothetical protein